MKSKTQTTYTLTKEHEKEFPRIRDEYIANALSTKPMDDEERDICRDAVPRLYKAAGLKPPSQITFVASPLALAYTAGVAAHAAETGALGAGDVDRIAEAIAERMQTETVDDSLWHRSPRISLDGLPCVVNPQDAMTHVRSAVSSAWQGGNQWSNIMARLAFYRDVAQLKLPKWDAYAPWHTLGLHSGPRCVYADFCVISDRPCAITLDDAGRPHNEEGPYLKWRDSTGIYSIHGVRVPMWLVETPDLLTEDKIWAQQDNEIRRMMIERYGPEKLFTNATTLDFDFQHVADDVPPIPRGLYQMRDGSKWMYCTDGGTCRCYALPMPEWVATCKEGYYAITGRNETLVRGRS